MVPKKVKETCKKLSSLFTFLSANQLACYIAVKLGFIVGKIQILNSEPIDYTFTVSRLRGLYQNNCNFTRVQEILLMIINNIFL